MITLAPGIGSASIVWSRDCGPMHLTGVWTASSQPSSWEESCGFEDEYHEPAWLGSRTVCLDAIVSVIEARCGGSVEVFGK